MDDQALTGAQKTRLRRLGQSMEASIHVGKAGLTPAFFGELRRLLEAGELVKLRFHGPDRVERAGLASRISSECPCTWAGSVGQTALFFRRNPDPARRRVELP
jgi:RNA-binding protein